MCHWFIRATVERQGTDVIVEFWIAALNKDAARDIMCEILGVSPDRWSIQRVNTCQS